MEITKDFIRDILHLKTVNDKKDVEVIHRWIYAVNHDCALFYDNERYDNDANKFRAAVIELSTKLAKKYSAEDIRTVAKYYELMNDWSIVDNIRKMSYDFNIFACDAETIDELRECVVEYVYDSIINKVDKLVETNPTNLPNITSHTLHDPIDNEIIVARACDSNMIILKRDSHTIYIPFDCDVNYFIKSRKEHSNIDVTYHSFEPFKITNSSQTKYIVCIYDIPKKEYNLSVEDDLGNAIKKYYKSTPRFNDLNFIIQYKDNNGENPILSMQ